MHPANPTAPQSWWLSAMSPNVKDALIDTVDLVAADPETATVDQIREVAQTLRCALATISPRSGASAVGGQSTASPSCVASADPLRSVRDFLHLHAGVTGGASGAAGRYLDEIRNLVGDSATTTSGPVDNTSGDLGRFDPHIDPPCGPTYRRDQNSDGFTQ